MIAVTSSRRFLPALAKRSPLNSRTNTFGFAAGLAAFAFFRLLRSFRRSFLRITPARNASPIASICWLSGLTSSQPRGGLRRRMMVTRNMAGSAVGAETTEPLAAKPGKTWGMSNAAVDPTFHRHHGGAGAAGGGGAGCRGPGFLPAEDPARRDALAGGGHGRRGHEPRGRGADPSGPAAQMGRAGGGHRAAPGQRRGQRHAHPARGESGQSPVRRGA